MKSEKTGKKDEERGGQSHSTSPQVEKLEKMKSSRKSSRWTGENGVQTPRPVTLVDL